jgi:hypothetical protein
MKTKTNYKKKNEFPILLADATVDELSKLSTVCERGRVKQVVPCVQFCELLVLDMP